MLAWITLIIITSLRIASILTSNPIILFLGGIGSGLFLASAILYPSEREKTERLYKATMIAYALGILVMSLVCRLAVDIANLLDAPDEGFIDSIRVQAMFIANLVALSPVVLEVVHLARLVHAFEGSLRFFCIFQYHAVMSTLISVISSIWCDACSATYHHSELRFTGYSYIK